MKAIETIYGGYRFRSRIEARWAVFFTRLGLEWEYEPQGYKLSSGSLYLPDFLLPELGLYIEIKPLNAFLVDPNGVRRWEEFAEDIAENWGHDRSVHTKNPGVRAEAVMLCGPIPDPDNVRPWGPQPAPDWPYQRGACVLGEAEWAWCSCLSGQHFGIQLYGRGKWIPCGCASLTDRDAYADALADGILYAIGERPQPDEATANDQRILNAYGAARSARFEHGEGIGGLGIRESSRRADGGHWSNPARPGSSADGQVRRP